MVLTTTNFRTLTDQVADSLGLLGARVVEVPHPLGGTEPSVVETWADGAVEATLALLTEST